MPDTPRLPMVLTAYGLPHVIGFTPAKDGTRYAPPFGAIDLMDAAVEMGYAGVEFDLWFFKSATNSEIRDALRERDLRIVADFMTMVDVDIADFRRYLEDAAFVGAKVVRAMISGVLCGERGTLKEGWPARMDRVTQYLKELLPVAEDLGLCIALENHQDATTDDLLRLYERSGESRAYGITLDTGNPLSVGEGPVEAAHRMGPLIRHVHMKDYTLHFAPEGYRLARCAAGQGVIDFPAILDILRKNGHGMLPGNEIAAQPTRTIPLLEERWWSAFPPGQAAYLPEALRVLWRRGRPMDEPYSSAWERGADSETVAREEWEVVRQSTDYFQSLLSQREANSQKE